MTLFEELEPPAPDEGPVVRVRLLIAYDGTGFRGIAAQPGQRTVGGELVGAVSKVLRADLHPATSLVVSGRTDAGVHAWGQVVHIDVPAPGLSAADLPEVVRKLNRMLAPELVVRCADLAPEGFDARRSATARRYRYTVCNRPVPDPFSARTAWWVPEPLDLRRMRAGCDPLHGTHDFSSFCRKQGNASLVRTIHSAEWLDLGDGFLRFDVEGGAFCQQMVRAMVGMLVQIGLGKLTAGEVPGILAVRDRSAARPIAPPHGLCLWEVVY